MNDETLLTLHCPSCAKLVEVVAENGMVVGNIIRSPIDNLVKYHLELATTQL